MVAVDSMNEGNLCPISISIADIDRVTASAIASGALQAIATEQTVVPTEPIDFMVRWVSSLAHKDIATRKVSAERRPDHNPFLPPEAALLLGPLGDRHLCLLNKFPVIDRHLLVVTREFEEQCAPLTHADFHALAMLMQTLGGLGFYNGGAEAGASQRHKHLQWIPESQQSISLAQLAQRLPVGRASTTTPLKHPALPYAHAFIRLHGADARHEADALATIQHGAFEAACQALGIDAGCASMPPYNLLIADGWMLLVPRRRERFEGISINALGFAASLFVRTPAELERIRALGPLQVLAEVAYPL